MKQVMLQLTNYVKQGMTCTINIKNETKSNSKKMPVKSERVIIGSSNVHNFYRKDDFSEYPEFQIMKCTRIHAFKAQMNLLDNDNKLIVISVIENFLADAARKGESDDPDN